MNSNFVLTWKLRVDHGARRLCELCDQSTALGASVGVGGAVLGRHHGPTGRSVGARSHHVSGWEVCRGARLGPHILRSGWGDGCGRGLSRRLLLTAHHYLSRQWSCLALEYVILANICSLLPANEPRIWQSKPAVQPNNDNMTKDHRIWQDPSV